MPDYDRLPLFGLQSVLFPEMAIPLQIFEPRYKLLVSECLERREPFGIVLLRSGLEVAGLSSEPVVPHRVGTMARITQCEWLPDGGAHIEVQGEARFAIEEILSDEPYMTGRVAPIWEQHVDVLQLQPLFQTASLLFRDYITQRLEGHSRHLAGLQLPQDPLLLSFAVASVIRVPAAQKQKMLAMTDTRERLKAEILYLQAAGNARWRTRGRDSLSAKSAKLRSLPAGAMVLPLEAASLGKFLSRN